MRWIVVSGIIACACGRIGFDPGGELDGDASSSTPDACNLGPWATPQKLVEVSSADQDYSPSLSADGLELIIQTDRPGGSGLDDLFVATRTNVSLPFGTPVPLENVNSPMQDQGPTLSNNALKIYFVSDRSGAYRTYVATRSTRAMAFSAPTLVPSLQFASYKGPAVSSDGTELFLTTLGATEDLARVPNYLNPAPGSATVEPLTTLNISMKNGFPMISGDGSSLYWESDAASTERDVFTATRPSVGAAFGTPTMVSELSTPSYDGDPDLSFDGRTMLLSSDRGTPGLSDIYFSTRACQ